MDRLAGAAGTGTAGERPGHWSGAARRWHLLGPPLRPAAQDIGFVQDAVRQWTGAHAAPPRVLLLGVTPELYRLPWPEGTDFLAVDRTRAMIDAVWPGPKENVQCTEWLAMGLPDGSRDIVLFDGGLNLLAYAEEQRRLARVLWEVLAEAGLCILRLFVPPARRESPDDVLRDLTAGRVANMSCLKMRLWMALQESAEQGVELDAVWRALHKAAPDLPALAAKIGWPVDETLGIDVYRGARSRYWLATLDQVTEMFCNSPGGFKLRRLLVPGYQLGEMCPTVVLRRCAGERH